MPKKPLQSIDNLHTSLDLDGLMENYSYQDFLTGKLDILTGDFNQATINEIALWKVNRYPHTDTDEESSVLPVINRISSDARNRDDALTGAVLQSLLACRGVALPMASTILRFKNPHIYQIIDRRVYRFIYGEEYKEPRAVDAQIVCYSDYLKRLEEVCRKYNIPFLIADRVLYQADIHFNKHISLK